MSISVLETCILIKFWVNLEPHLSVTILHFYQQQAGYHALQWYLQYLKSIFTPKITRLLGEFILEHGVYNPNQQKIHTICNIYRNIIIYHSWAIIVLLNTGYSYEDITYSSDWMHGFIFRLFAAVSQILCEDFENAMTIVKKK